jgi:hypothetical protein
MFKASTASTVITPTESVWLTGFAARTAPSRGKINDLFAKTVAIEDTTGKRIVIVSCDLIAISRDVAQRVSLEVKKRFGLNRDELLLCSTHTHYGPELRPDKIPFFKIPPEFAAKVQPYADFITTTLITLIGDALKNLKPAKLFTTQSTADFATNRRPGEDPIDHDVPILQITDESNKPMAILFGYACHNTTMPFADCLISTDWAGFAAETIQQQFPGAIAMFIAGAGADQNPNPKGPLEVSRKHAATLANSVLTALKSAREIDGEITTAFTEVPLEYEPFPSRESLQFDTNSYDAPRSFKAQFLLDQLNQGHRFDPTYPCPLQTLRIGNRFLLIAIGGEPVIDYAVNLKQEFAAPDKLVWIAGYANDMFGYVPTPRVLSGGGYEGTRSVLWAALPMPFTDTVEDRVLSGIRNLLKNR